MDSDVSPTDQSASVPTSLNGSPKAEFSAQTVEAPPQPHDLESYNPIEPPPLDWRSDSSSDAGCSNNMDDPTLHPSIENLGEASVIGPVLETLNPIDISHDTIEQEVVGNISGLVQDLKMGLEEVGEEAEKVQSGRTEYSDSAGEYQEEVTASDLNGRTSERDVERAKRKPGDEDHSSIHSLLSQLQLIGEEPLLIQPLPPHVVPHEFPLLSEPDNCTPSLLKDYSTETTGLLFSESHHRDLLGLLQFTELSSSPQPSSPSRREEVDAIVAVSYSQEDAQRLWAHHDNEQQLQEQQQQQQQQHRDSITSLSDDEYPEPVWKKRGEEPPKEDEAAADTELLSSYKDVPGPCDPEDLLDGVVFGAKYLGSTQLKSEKNPSTNARMTQAQEAVDRIKAPEGESQPMTEVDLFISTQRIKVLSADTQEAMMDHSLQMISYIADIGDIVVLMARRKLKGQDSDAAASSRPQKKCVMICHVFSSEDAQVIAQAIGQAFGVAYQQFLDANGIKPSDLQPGDYSSYLESQELYNGDLAHFSDSQNIRDVAITKASGEILGLAVVESGWGSILPTVVVANLLHGGPAERCGELNIGDRIMSINGTSMVGLPITTCQNIIRICSLMRGGIAERGGIRVGHRIIEINGQSVVATTQDKIIQILSNAVGEIHLKTMPASTYRLLTGQEQPVFL
ncbi:amyloid-beta A4 precursor protein-binding family A member 3 isoform X2 [Nelusetta ayraudi]|uniref:amyloid-beta A4 precursor protein-binding family A member 3 isoform X2 n=1 Tax=Nelusetta ayraudi TaxID=303726 RepID=UPI003F6FF3B7